MVFDGKGFAVKIEEDLRGNVERMAGRLGRRPKLVSIYNLNDEPSRVYTAIKSRKAEELGVEFQAIRADSLPPDQLRELVGGLNSDEKTDGVMIQVPFPQSEELIPLIDPNKDVDGMREDSPYKPAVVRAVLSILKSQIPHSASSGQANPSKIIVVGSTGFVGRRLVEELKCEGMDKEDFDPEKLRQADVVISATGQAGLIGPEMVKEGVVAIDVGYPQGDFDPAVAGKAAFFTPVPGGVGPVTVVMLYANLMEAVERNHG